MKYTKYAVLSVILMLIVLSAVGTLVVWLYGKILGVSFDSVLYTGVQVGAAATVLVLLLSFIRTKLRNKK